MILVVDHYDSFTYNLVHDLGAMSLDPVVVMYDAISLDEIAAMAPAGLVLSPGPGHPRDTGSTGDIIRRFYSRIPILGVCLGHQVLAMTFGASIVAAPTVVHGKSSAIFHDGTGLFSSLESPLDVGRYHSLMIDGATLSADMSVTARTQDGVIMGIQHVSYPVFGIQFHPESVLTPLGKSMLGNFAAFL